jgi:hypothetical protein
LAVSMRCGSTSTANLLVLRRTEMFIQCVVAENQVECASARCELCTLLCTPLLCTPICCIMRWPMPNVNI